MGISLLPRKVNRQKGIEKQNLNKVVDEVYVDEELQENDTVNRNRKW